LGDSLGGGAINSGYHWPTGSATVNTAPGPSPGVVQSDEAAIAAADRFFLSTGA
jgi:hypothetical protein